MEFLKMVYVLIARDLIVSRLSTILHGSESWLLTDSCEKSCRSSECGRTGGCWGFRRLPGSPMPICCSWMNKQVEVFNTSRGVNWSTFEEWKVRYSLVKKIKGRLWVARVKFGKRHRGWRAFGSGSGWAWSSLFRTTADKVKMDLLFANALGGHSACRRRNHNLVKLKQFKMIIMVISYHKQRKNFLIIISVEG